MQQDDRTYEEMIEEQEANRRKKFNNLRNAKKDIWWSIHGALENIQYWDEDLINSLTEAQKERYFLAFEEITQMIARKAGFQWVQVGMGWELRQV